MAETLSQEEIDALREAVASGDTIDEDGGGAGRPDQVKVTSYDFRKPRIVSGEQRSVLRMIHESLAKDLQSRLVTGLKVPIEVKLVAMDEISYSEYVLSLTNPTYLALLSTTPESGECGLEISTAVVSTVLDVLLGGEGVAPDGAVELTPLEVGIFRNVADVFLDELKAAWVGTSEVAFEVLSEESNPEYAQMTTPEAPCLTITFDVHVAESEGVLTLCYPFDVVQSLFARSAARVRSGQADGARATSREMLRAMENVPLDVHAVVGSGRISAQGLGRLKAGDVLCLDRRYDEPLDLYVGTNLAYSVRAAQKHGNVVVDLTGMCAELDHDDVQGEQDAGASEIQGDDHG